MRNHASTLFSGLIAACAVLAVTFSASGCQQARALESFELGQHDHILAESPGCHVECRVLGGIRRTCTVNNYDCRAVCMEVPDCNVMGRGAPKICAIMKTR